MKPDPYKTKASRAWKRKHPQKKVSDSKDKSENDLSGNELSGSDISENDSNLDIDTQILLDLKDKLILSSDQRDPEYLNLKLKFTPNLSGLVKEEEKRSFKGFHDQIFSSTIIKEENKSNSKKNDSQDLEEWLDDILG